MLKTCNCCKEELPVESFTPKRGECRPCVARKQREWSASTGYRMTDEYRQKKSIYRKSVRALEVNRARERRHSDAYKAKYPEKAKAHRILRQAIVDGSIVRPAMCDDCHQQDPKISDGKTAIHGHHDDYSKPLEVRWLCPKCHAAAHRALAEKEPK